MSLFVTPLKVIPPTLTSASSIPRELTRCLAAASALPDEERVSTRDRKDLEMQYSYNKKVENRWRHEKHVPGQV